jgi:hypothetical protein
MKLFIEPGYLIDPAAPTLTAELVIVDGVTRFRAWCPHCLDWHYHGRPHGIRVLRCLAPKVCFQKTAQVQLSP